MSALILLTAPLALHSQVVRMPGAATEIGAGANGSAFVIGTSPCNGSGCNVYAYRNHNWKSLPGTAVRVAADPFGDPWVVNEKGEIFRFSAGRFVQVSGLATDIAIGANGAVFVIGTSPCDESGCTVYLWDGANWHPYPGTGVRIAVDPSGNPWLVNRSREIFRWNGSQFRSVWGAATDIAVGQDGSVHIVGTDGCDSSGCMVYRRDGQNWTARDVTAVNIAAASRSDVWVTDSLQQIFRIGATANNQQASR